MKQRKTTMAAEAAGVVENQLSATGLGPDVVSDVAAPARSKGKGGLSQQPRGNNERPQRDLENIHHSLFLGTERLRVQRAPFLRPRPRHPRSCISRCRRRLSPGSKPSRWSAVATYCAQAFRARAPSPQRGVGGGAARDRPRAR
jgi:hypothetical protein